MSWHVYVLVGVLVIIDIVTGIFGAIINKELSSTKMREGLGHKFAYFALIALAEVLVRIADYVDIGFDCTVLVAGVCVLIVLCEVTSILENCCKINPQLIGSKLINLFPQVKKGE
nr:MAG TPA: holin [Bacteriophage sp.]